MMIQWLSSASMTDIAMIVLLWYVIMGMMSALLVWYNSDFYMPVEMLLIIIIAWWYIIVRIVSMEGIAKVFRMGFLEDKKGFATRFLIANLSIALLFLITTIIENISR